MPIQFKDSVYRQFHKTEIRLTFFTIGFIIAYYNTKYIFRNILKTRLPSVMNRITYLKNRLEIENNVLLQKSYLRLEMMKNIALSKFDIYTIVFFRKLIYVEKVATMYDLSIRQQVFLIFYFSFSEINKFP